MQSIGRGLVTVAMMAAFLGGCCGRATSVEVPQSTMITATTGQQLIDLKKAYEDGAINKDQYEKMKQDIINKSGK